MRYTKDWRGVNIYVDDTIIYATRTGSRMQIIEAVVKEITDEGLLKVKRIRYNSGTGKANGFAPATEWHKPREIVTVSTSYVTKV